jgi:hypothetical protein
MPPLVGEVSANPCWYRSVAWSLQQIPTAVNIGFLDRSRYFFIQVAPQFYHEAEWTPFQNPYLAENMVGPGIEPGICGYVARN